MKKLFVSLVVAIMATMTVSAQQIAVVTNGATQTYQTLKDAIEGASDGSVIYLPGGTFSIGSNITKKLTIIGISHKASSDNVDGCTILSGTLTFSENSSGSAVMGCYITGGVDVGVANTAYEVKDILIKYCNINNLVIQSGCSGTMVNQCYVRNKSWIYTTAKFTNCILGALLHMKGGEISNNILIYSYDNDPVLASVNNVIISGNVFIGSSGYSGSNCQVFNNMATKNIGEDCVVINGEWSEVFKKHAGITTASDYHFIGDYTQYEDKIGIYAGTGFSDGALPPVPYIVESRVDEQTDAAGKLNIRIHVKAKSE